jgi:hypothetical protein
VPMLLPALGLVGAVVLGAVEATPFVGGRAEVAAGRSPPSPGLESDTALVTELRPGVGARLEAPRWNALVGAVPRIYYRVPNGNVYRPLFLLEMNGTASYQVSPRLTWGTLVSSSVGEVNYTNTQLVLNTPIARDVQQPVVTAATVDGSTGLTWDTTPTHRLSLALASFYTTPMGNDSNTTIRRTLAVGFDLTQTWDLSPRSSLVAPLRARHYFVDRAADSNSVELSFGYRRSLDLRTSFSAGAGVAAADSADVPIRFLPVGNLTLERVMHQTRAATLSNRASVHTTASFDPTRGQLYPVAGADLSALGQLGTKWRPSLTVEAFTTLGARSATAGGTSGRTTARATISYLLTQEVSLDTGVRAGANLVQTSKHLALVDREFMLFVSVTYQFAFAQATQH